MNVDLSKLITAEAKTALAAEALKAAKAAAKVEVQQWIDGFLAGITGPIPMDEKLSWSLKTAAARSVTPETSNAEALAILGPEAQIRGITVYALAQRVLVKSALFTTIAAMTAGLRDNTWAAIDQAASDAEIAAALLAAKAQAADLAAQLGIGA